MKSGSSSVSFILAAFGDARSFTQPASLARPANAAGGGVKAVSFGRRASGRKSGLTSEVMGTGSESGQRRGAYQTARPDASVYRTGLPAGMLEYRWERRQR